MQPFADCTVGLSSFNGKILARLTATDGMALRTALIPLISHFRTGGASPACLDDLNQRGSVMNLTPREKDKLLIAMAAMVARRRL